MKHTDYETSYSPKDLALTGIMTALVFTGTFFLKIPSPFGYTHLGDCMIILSVRLLGTRRGALAGAIGAGLADFLGGYAIWILPTIILKMLWALIIGLFSDRLLPGCRCGWLPGAIVGGIVHVTGYFLVNIPLYGTAAAFAELPGLTAQTGTGIVLSAILYHALSRSQVIRRLKA